jgi:VanZ family protein
MNFITLAYALGLAALLLLVDFGALRDVALYINHTFLLDKAIHFTAFGVLALLANATLLHRSRLHRSHTRALGAIATGSAIVLLLSTLEEGSNAFVSFRTCSLADLAANYLGIVCLGVLPLVAWQRSQTRPSQLA